MNPRRAEPTSADPLGLSDEEASVSKAPKLEPSTPDASNDPGTPGRLPATPDASDRNLSLLGLRQGPLALASRSPRRRELLQRLEIPLVFVDVDVQEGDRQPHEPAERYVQRLSERKLDAALGEAPTREAYAVLAADTVVVVGEDVLEKPNDRNHAVELLTRLDGRWHEVWTGLALQRISDGRRVLAAESSRVFFEMGSRALRELYLETNEPMDKAGGYGIQGWGGLFVPRIEGDYFNVMGLPLYRLRMLCQELESCGKANERDD